MSNQRFIVDISLTFEVHLEASTLEEAVDIAREEVLRCMDTVADEILSSSPYNISGFGVIMDSENRVRKLVPKIDGN